MSNDNALFVVGNLVADPELEDSRGGHTFCKVRIAVNRREKDSDGQWKDGDPQFFGGTLWREMAENFASSFKKGDRVIIIGELDFRQWQQDGQNRSVVELKIHDIGASVKWARLSVQRITRSQGGGNSGGRQRPPAPKPREFFGPDEAPF